MAQLVLGAVGAVGGFIISGGNPLGAQLGWAIGSAIGGRMSAPDQHGPRLQDLRVTGTEYGQPIPYVIGAPRIAAQLWWSSDRREIATTESAGKGGGPTSTTYTYEMDALFGLTDGENDGVTRVFWNGKLIWTNLEDADDQSRIDSALSEYWSRLTVYTGSVDQMPDATYEAAVGSSLAPGYRGRACVFIQGMQLGNSGQLPNLTFEVCSSLSTSATIVRRHSVNPTGVQFRDISTTGVGTPAIVAMQPEVRVAIVSTSDVTVYRFDIEGVYLGTSTRSGASEIYPGPAGSPGTYPVGIIDGDPVRWQNIAYTTGDALHRLLPIGTLNNTGSEITVGADLTSVLPSGEYLGQVAMCSDGAHALIMTAPSTTYTGLAVINKWYLVRRSGGVTTLVDSGTLEAAVSVSKFGFGNSTTYHFGCCMLEEDLQHLWWAYGAGQGNVAMYRIDDDGVLRLRSELISGNGLPFWTNTYPSIWVEAGYCVTVSRQSFAAFARAGDAIQLVTLRTTVEALCERAGMTSVQFDASPLASITKPVRALVASQVGPTRAILEQLQAGYFFEACLSDKLYFRPRASLPVATIPFADLAAGRDQADAEPLALTIHSDLEISAQVAVQYKNMADDQQTGTEYSDRVIAGQASLDTISLALGFTPAEAKGIADAIVTDRAASQVTTTISLPLEYAELEASDVVLVVDEDGTTTYRLRFTRKTDEAGVLKFEAVVDDAAVVTSAEVTTDDYTPSATVRVLANTNFAALDIPMLSDADNAPGYYVAAMGAGTNWPGGQILSSADGVDYALAATIAESGVLGTCTTTLGNWAGGLVMDEINSVTVNVLHGELSSTTRDALFGSATANAILIGSEIIRFVTATLQSASPNIYTLSRLLRGQRGTEWAMALHVANEECVLLRPQGLRRVASELSNLNKAIYIKGVTLGKLAADVSPETFTNTGVSTSPPPPVDLRYSRDEFGNFSLTWKRRTRLSTVFCGPGGISVPLGETSEAYEIDVMNGSSVVRTIYSVQQSAAYGSDEQEDDFGAIQTSVAIRLYQIGLSPRGRYLSATMQTDYSPTAQTSTISFGGSFVQPVSVVVRANLSVVASITTAPGDVDLSGVASRLAGVISAAGLGYSAAVGGVSTDVDVTGNVGRIFTLDVEVGGSSTATVAITQSGLEETDGSPYSARIVLSNRIDSAAQIVPSGTELALNFQWQQTGTNNFERASFSYITTTDVTINGALGLFALLTSSNDSLLRHATVWNGGVGRLLCDANFWLATITSGGATDPWIISVVVENPGTPRNYVVVVQIATITLAGTVATGEIFTAEIDGTQYSYTAIGGDGVNEVATGLAAAVDAGPLSAAAVGAVVTVTGAAAGTPFVLRTLIQRVMSTTIT